MKKKEALKSKSSRGENLKLEEKIEMAIRRYSVYPFLSYERLSKEFDRAQAVIPKAIKEVFEQKLVEISIKRSVSPSKRNERLEREMLSRFNVLTKCVVVDNEAINGDGGNDDAIHEQLGMAMAEMMAANQGLFRNGDVIGIGSGRGVYYAIKALEDYPEMRVSVTLFALTGTVTPRDYKKKLNVLLDADVLLGLLGPRFSRPVTSNPISHFIAIRQDETMDEELTGKPISSQVWKELEPTHALLGIGVLADGHRFYNEVKAPSENEGSPLFPIKEELNSLVSLCERITDSKKTGYFPVSDIANRLFFVEPPRGVEVSAQDKKDIANLIEQINSRLVTVKSEQLKRIDNLLIVAGTAKKALAIKQLLRTGYNIRYLCLDAEAASTILGRA